MAGGLAERKKPEHIHNPSGPRAFLLRPRYKEPSGSTGPGSGHARGRAAVKGWGLGMLNGEWQCNPHCHSGVNVLGWYARGRVAVKGWGLGTLEGEWQCGRDCHSGVNVLVGTFRGEWQCVTGAKVRSTASGSATHTATRARTCRDGTLKGEWQCYIHRSYWFSSPSTSCLKNARFLLKFSVSARIFFPRAFAIALMTASKL